MAFLLSIEPIAKSLLGDPNRQLSSKTELRYGTRGSLAIDLRKDTWFDHEANTGGGVLDLITFKTGLQGVDRSQWLREQGFEEQRRSKGVIVAVFPYEDETGEELFQVVKFDPKDFRQRRRDKSKPGGWIWSIKGVRQVPYRLPELIEALSLGRTIYYVEGEKDVERLRSLGFAATTSPGGAGKWRHEFSEEFFRHADPAFSADVIIIPDKDPQKRDPKTNEPMFHEDGRPIHAGQDHAEEVAASLAAVGARVRVLELWKTGRWPEMPDKGDVSKWLDSGGGTPELLNEYTCELPDWTPQQRINGHDKSPATPLRLREPFTEIDHDLIPPRSWISPGLLMRRHVTVLVAPSGAGKSLLTLQVGMAAASGKAWGGWLLRKNPRGYRVLFINAEDDYDEIRRRLAAALQVMPDLDREMLCMNFKVADAEKMVIAKFDPRKKELIHQPMYEALVQTIKDNEIDIVVVDPFAETFSLDENSNNELKEAGILWRNIARETNAALLLVHHTKKYATGMAGDVDAARGASALIGIARIVCTLFPMTERESELLLTKDKRGERYRYLRFDDAKANLNLASTIARWFRKDTKTLSNARPDDGIPDDEVGTLVPEKLQRATQNFLEDEIIRFLKAVDEGIFDKNGKHTGEYYTFDKRKAHEHEISRYVAEFAQSFFKFPALDQAVEYIQDLVEKGRLVHGKKYKSRRTRHERTRCISELHKDARDQSDTEQEQSQMFPAE